MAVGIEIGGGVGFVDRWLWWVFRMVVEVDFQIGGGGGGFVDWWCWWIFRLVVVVVVGFQINGGSGF